MQPQVLRPSVQWRCLLLVFMAIPMAATPEEGTILRYWLGNMTSASNALASWRISNSADPCDMNADWYGVSCGNSSNVLSVNLQSAQISGPLVPELGQLSLLTSLLLDGNGFYGPIPQEFGNLSALTSLSPSRNISDGSIPTSLGKLTKLESLNLDTNVLTGSIPQELGSLPALTYLFLSGNRLKDLVPFTGGLANKLELLGLNYNNFSGPYPESLASFPFLSRIDLDLNNITGVLNVSRVLELLNTTGAKNNISFMNQSVSLMNNNIMDVSLAVGNLQIRSTVAFRLLGNPYCARPTKLYDDLRRCLCQQEFLCYLPNYPKGSHTISSGVIIGISFGIVFVLAIVVLVIFKRLSKGLRDTWGTRVDSLLVLLYANMDAGFSDALRIINDVKVLDQHSFHINTRQCMRLVGFYMKVGEFFENAKKACEDFLAGKAMLSLDATLSVLQKGQVLLTKYTKDDWHTIMMIGGLNQGSFEAIHLELEACIQSIREFLEEKVPEIKLFPFMHWGYLGTPLLLLAERDRERILGRDADKDKNDMLAKVESTRLETNNTRSLTEEERSSMILSLDMASESLQDEKPTLTSSTKFEELPAVLRINPSHIELGVPLGSGGSAEVRKCRWSEVDCAVKILKRGDVNGLRAEVGKLMELRHPNIVTLFGFSVGKGDLEGQPMIVMELLNGDLRFLLRQPKLNLSKVVDIMHKIATRMKYLHSRGIFHGDLKSMNVLVSDLTGQFEVKISDFGVSQQINKYAADHDTDDSNADAVNTKSFNGRVGTPMWMAPEVLTSSSGDGNNMYSAKADVYSFAMVCVEILTGKRPYNQSLAKLKDIREYVVDEGKRSTLPQSVPNDLRELIVQCWDKNPERRPDFHQICTHLQKLQIHSLPL